MSKNTMSDKSSPEKASSSKNKQETSATAAKANDSKDSTQETSKAKQSEKADNNNSTADKKASSTVTTKQARNNKSATSAASAAKPSNKLAITAIAIACISVLASGFHYLEQQKQNAALIDNIKQQNNAAIEKSRAQTKQQLITEFKQELRQQQQAFAAELQQVSQQINSASEDKIAQLSQQVAQLETRITQRQPSDWLVHEAEYLIRVAARTMWQEKDTKAAIGLLKDADSRLAELSEPKYLPVRATIHEDIKALELMPTLQSQEAVLSLMALDKQISTLPLIGDDLGNLSTNVKELELSSDISDWKSNLSKSWQNFLDDFIRIRPREGSVEPLISPKQQQNLKHNLSLKVQLAIWAVREGNTEVYQQALSDVQKWTSDYFDMQSPRNTEFYQSIEKLKTYLINYNYPSDLPSLTAIKSLIQESSEAPIDATEPSEDVGVTEGQL
ncbi:uroporphyrinogen-III C-methyltransferase [Litorilituus sediminis]|uniref:Heme biosynthesis operon protein HemX n=1 Tax=Litorilituus sediminis TaxID=718192 RepID=A0A4P6P3S3_9GAMM|nr:uroporphyrinogen-III C-methyltransferase [Litorilituus sediminis]QBG36216.1 heme biosynthesis operon protein HemX [Litorilituus sediminis]